MTIEERTLPDDAEVLKTIVMELETEITHLREQIRLLTHKHFGPSSEKLSREQLRLFLKSDESMETEEAETENAVTVKEHRRRKCGRRPLPASLPRIDVIHDLSDEEKICPNDGETLRKIGEETSEQLSYIPATMRVLRHVRFKYACPRCEDGVKIAPLPPQPIPKSMAAPSLLAHVTVSKYVDALPLHRQSKMLERIGIDLPRATLANWMIATGKLVQPLINLMRDDLLSGPVIQCDETRCQVLKEPGKPAQSQSYLWAERGGTAESPVILFDYDPSRSGEVPKRLLEGYVGYLQTDGYKGYDAVCAENEGIRRAGCMAHARRKFDEAFKVQLSMKGKKGKSRSKRLRDSKANQGLGYIRKLYDIERTARGMSPEERKEIRLARAQPILDELKEWMQETKDLVPPRSRTGRALMYLWDRWKYLMRYLEDGRLEIDN
ncbi:MAG: IS66 family transposase, partial [Candidatus Eisenbacteria sp.]|nr:IS66 family transposase [Candidatus Eisenbacteria bacterium]